MLFAAWTENRATEEAESSSSSIRTDTGSIHTVPRPNSIAAPDPVTRLGDLNCGGDTTIDSKLEKPESEPTETIESLEDERPGVFKSTFSEVCCVLSLICIQLANAFAHAQTITIPALTKKFHLTTGQQAWVSASMGIPAGSFLILFGRLADIFGRKRVLITALISYSIGGVVSGTAPHIYAFYIGRSMQGLAVAGFFPAGIGILASLYQPGRRKNRVFAAFSAGQPLGGAIGSMTAGLLTTYVSWRWTYYFQALLGTLFVGIIFLFVPNDARQITRREPIDWFGALLVSAGLCLFCFGLTDADTSPDGWVTSYIIISLILGLACVGLFVWLQLRLKYPLIPPSLLRYPQFPRVILTYFLGFTTFAGVLIYNYMLMWQLVFGRNALGAAIWNIPLWSTGLVTNLVASFILHRVSGTILLILAEGVILAASLLQSFDPRDLTYWAMTFPSLPLMIIGAEFSYLVCSLFVLESVQKPHLSIAAGVFTSLMSLGSAIGAASSSAIRQHVSGQMKSINGFHAAFYLGVGMSGAALLIAMTVRVDKRGTREERIQKQHEEMQGERAVDAQPRSEMPVV